MSGVAITELVRHAGGAFGCRIASMILMFGINVMLARIMQPEEFGLFVQAQASLNLAALIGTAGLMSTSMRQVPSWLQGGVGGGIRSAVRRASGTVFLCGCLAACGMVVIHAMSSGLAPSLLVLAALIPVLSVMMLRSSVLHALGHVTMSMLPRMVLRPIMLILFVFVAVLMAWELTAFQTAVLLVLAFIPALIFQEHVLDRCLPEASAVERPLRFSLSDGGVMLVINIFAVCYYELNIIAAGLVLAPAELGVFSIALQLANMVGVLLFALNAALGPSLSKAWHANDRAGCQHLLSMSIHLRVWPIAVAVVIVAFFAPQLLAIFGEHFVTGDRALLLCCLGQLIVAASGPLMMVVTIAGERTTAILAFLASGVVLVVGNLVLAPVLGINGSAGTFLIANLVWNVGIVWAISQRLRLGVSIFQPLTWRGLMRTAH